MWPHPSHLSVSRARCSTMRPPVVGSVASIGVLPFWWSCPRAGGWSLRAGRRLPFFRWCRLGVWQCLEVLDDGLRVALGHLGAGFVGAVHAVVDARELPVFGDA